MLQRGSRSAHTRREQTRGGHKRTDWRWRRRRRRGGRPERRRRGWHRHGCARARAAAAADAGAGTSAVGEWRARAAGCGGHSCAFATWHSSRHRRRGRVRDDRRTESRTRPLKRGRRTTTTAAAQSERSRRSSAPGAEDRLFQTLCLLASSLRSSSNSFIAFFPHLHLSDSHLLCNEDGICIFKSAGFPTTRLVNCRAYSISAPERRQPPVSPGPGVCFSPSGPPSAIFFPVHARSRASRHPRHSHLCAQSIHIRRTHTRASRAPHSGTSSNSFEMLSP
jgi:hypothetical protein